MKSANCLFEKITLVILVIHLQSCVMHRSDLKLKIINLTNTNVYIGSLSSYGCDSCEIKRDVGFHCSEKDVDSSMLRTVNARDNVDLQDKLLNSSEKIYAINVDSLNAYCNKATTYKIVNKPWVKIFSGIVNWKEKTCTIIIR